MQHKWIEYVVCSILFLLVMIGFIHVFLQYFSWIFIDNNNNNNNNKNNKNKNNKNTRNEKKPFVVVAGIGYNVRNAIEKWRSVVSTFLNEYASDYRMIFYENDSTDGTGEYLKEWAQQDSKIWVQCDKKWQVCARNTRKPHEKLGQITEILAECRNQYLRVLYEHQEEFSRQNNSVLWILDMDTQPDFHQPAMIQLLTNPFYFDQWDMIWANGLMNGQPYDSLAFYDQVYWEEPHDLLPSKIETNQHENQSIFWTHEYILDKRHYMTELMCNHMNNKNDISLVPVTSAFGGMGFYKLDLIFQTEPKPFYAGRRSILTIPTCEHVIFHDQIKTSRKYICPQWTVTKGPHVGYDT